MDKKLHKKIADRQEKGTLRSLSTFEGMIDFASNDYLGFAKNQLVESSLPETGATGSRLISGNAQFIEEVEQDLANFFDAEAGLCFNSGYDANLGIFSSIPQRGDVVLYDEFIHASARDGIRLSHAKSYGFKHNDIKDLKRLMESNKSDTIYIAIEGLYSMHGDLCPLLEIVQLAREYNAYVILDEAHSAGNFGDEGRGFAHALELGSACLIRLITFGKAFGGHGAVVLCSTEMREYLINFARSFIYTTALPLSVYDKMRKSIGVENLDKIRFLLQNKIAYFRGNLRMYTFSSVANSPIQFVRFANVDQLRKMEVQLRKSGVFAKAIFPPTVPEGDEGLRISLHSFNSDEEIDALVRIMS